MALLRREGGRRRGVGTALAFASSLFVYLVITAVPALAVDSSCGVDPVIPSILNVVVGTDDTLALPTTAGRTYHAAVRRQVYWVDNTSITAGVWTSCGTSDRPHRWAHHRHDGRRPSLGRARLGPGAGTPTAPFGPRTTVISATATTR
jgi:hypothetical protein